MIRSMTGFGDASVESRGVHYTLELRSLNNKYFKALVRMPEELAPLEAEFEAALRKRVQRGSFTLSVGSAPPRAPPPRASTTPCSRPTSTTSKPSGTSSAITRSTST